MGFAPARAGLTRTRLLQGRHAGLSSWRRSGALAEGAVLDPPLRRVYRRGWRNMKENADMKPRIETREVLAGAYVRGGAKDRMLSHAVEVDANDFAIRVLCHRVQLESLADRYASDPHAPPTCSICRRRVETLARDVK
jgi:hypothetical protein